MAAPEQPRWSTLTRRSGYDLAKAMDGLPGEWSFPIFGMRAMTSLSVAGTYYYEPLAREADVAAVMRFRELLVSEGLGEHQLPGVTVAADWYSGSYSAPHGRLATPASGRHVGQHLVPLVGMTGRVYRFANSWGERWGDDGYGTMSREYLRRHGTGFWSARVFCLGPPVEYLRHALAHPHTDRSKLTGLGPAAYLWQPSRREPKRVVVDGDVLETAHIASLPDTRPVRCAWVVDGQDMPVGWIYVSERVGGVHRVDELFVLPEHRRKGHATRLIGWARDGVADRLTFRVYEADRVANGYNAVHLPGALTDMLPMTTGSP